MTAASAAAGDAERSSLAAHLAEVRRAAAPDGLAVHLVGGGVRDLLLGRVPHDLDVVVLAPIAGTELFVQRASREDGLRLVRHHTRFGTATLAAPDGFRVDVAAARREEYPRPGALPVVRGGATLEEDLARRDFSVHAMAREIRADGSLGPLVDPFGGAADLASRRLRLLHDRSLADDPTRALRGARYAARLGFEIDEEGFARALAASRAAGSWRTCSGDRLRRGLEEVLSEPEWARGLGLLDRLGVLADIHPSLGAPAGPCAAEGVAARWRYLLSRVPPSERAAVGERLSFPGSLRQAVGWRG